MTAMTISDTERREMARKIRELPDSATWTADRIGEALLHLLVYGDGRESLNLLADLIEPGCDRDALLELVDEMGRVRSRCDFCIKKGDCDWADETVCLESRIDDYAQRIREALGASE